MQNTSLSQGAFTIDFSQTTITDRPNIPGNFPFWNFNGTELANATNTVFPALPAVCRYDARIPAVTTQIACDSSAFIVPRVVGSMWDPVWSPSGDRVAYLKVIDANRVDIALRNADDQSGISEMILTEGLTTSSIHMMPAWAL